MFAEDCEDEVTLNGQVDVRGDAKRDAAHVRLVWGPQAADPCLAPLLLLDAPLIIGRGPHAQLRLPDAQVSRQHLRLSWDARSLAHQFHDLQSRNGTKLNGKVAASGWLTHSDVLRIGDSLLVYEGASVWTDVQRRALLVAPSNVPILLLGETGVGKEYLARRVHEASGRRGRFVPVNCAALPRELVPAELFGHARGAFTGAASNRAGLFEAAQHGTLFLDEIGDLPLPSQPALLRALDSGEVRAVGSDQLTQVDVRLLAATNKDLSAMVSAGTFREDLFARLSALTLAIPPLRTRRAQLAKLLMQGLSVPLSPCAAEAMLLWDWPQNVRELKLLSQAMSAMSGLDVIRLADLAQVRPDIASFAAVESAPGNDYESGQFKVTRGLDKSLLASALAECSGNVSAAARRLGTTRARVYRWVRFWGLDEQAGPRGFRARAVRGRTG